MCFAHFACLILMDGSRQKEPNNIMIDLWWQKDNTVSLKTGYPYPLYPKSQLILQEVLHLLDVVWLYLSVAEGPWCSHAECWSWCWTWRVNGCKDKLNSYGISKEDLSYWIDAVDTERNEIMPSCSSSMAKNLLKWAVIWAGTHYPLIKKNKELLIGLLCTL